MPELPEVEHFRCIIEPLVCSAAGAKTSSSKKSSCVTLECPPPRPTKRFPSEDVINAINEGGYVMTDVLRKGKVLCVILEKADGASAKKKGSGRKHKAAKESAGDNNAGPITGNESKLYLSLHMGMTGRMSSPTHVPGLESLSGDDAYPPPHTHLILKSNGQEAAFSDPRRFGSVLVDVGLEGDDSIPTFQDIAIDALEVTKAYCTAKSGTDSTEPSVVEKLMNRKKGIKGLLLDQRAVCSGVGNWVADEVLYRSCLHPDQSYLHNAEAKKLVEELYSVLSTAIECLNDGKDFPDEWLFHRRWRNGASGSTGKDYNGKTITFIQSGGRSTAVVPSLQKVKSRKSAGKAALKSSKKDAKEQKVQQKRKAASAKSSAKANLNASKDDVQKRKRADKAAASKKKAEPKRRSKRLRS